jgi:transglutaminase-like putative cysteine protease
VRIDRPVSLRQSWWLLATAVAAFLPLTPQLPTGLAIAVAVTLLVRGLISWKQWHLPPRWILVPVTLAGAGIVFWYYRTIFGRTPGIALLAVFLALKLLELRVARDALAVVLLSYFLVLANFMFTQTIAAGAMALATVLITTATLAAAADDRPAPLLLVRRAGIMLLQGLPFMFVLFVLFPRIDGPLWGLPQDRFTSKSGIPDEMSPGSIAQLSQSDAVAFRVKFEGETPAQELLYWRGPVMPNFDGRTWRISQTLPAHTSVPYQIGDRQPIDYELTLESHGKSWLFALELPDNLPPQSAMTRDLQLLSSTPVRNRLRYHLRSVPDTAFGANAPRTELAESLMLPPNVNPRMRKVAAGWRADAEAKVGADEPTMQQGDQAKDARIKVANDGTATDARILALAENFFLRQLLNYTLTPPLLGENSVDDFVFDTKRGFCEHFATAFVFALRAAGVPARVVAGYQGGEMNPVDGYLVVRQYDAHAWSEVWLQGRGWVRVDPTAITAPRRIADSFAASAPAGEALPLLARGDLAWLRELRDRFDAVANGWNQWVLGYNSVRQREFLQNLGLPTPDWKSMTALLAGICGTLMLALTGWILWQRRHIDPLLSVWLIFTRRLAKRGVVWQSWEGPLDFSRRAAATLPAQAAAIAEIAQLYAQLRYGRNDKTLTDKLKQLRRRIRNLSV